MLGQYFQNINESGYIINVGNVPQDTSILLIKPRRGLSALITI